MRSDRSLHTLKDRSELILQLASESDHIYNSIRERLRELALLKSSQTMMTEATSTAAAATHDPTPTFEAWLQNIL